MTMLSASICRASRPRLAPMAVRIAISRRRLSVRASSRFVMLTHPIKSTAPTAAHISDRPLRTRPATWSTRGTTFADAFNPGAGCGSVACNVFREDTACAMETAGFSRARHAKLNPVPASSPGVVPRGFQICGGDVVAMIMGNSSLTLGNGNGGRTPTISYGSLLRATVRPTTRGSAARAAIGRSPAGRR